MIFNSTEATPMKNFQRWTLRALIAASLVFATACGGSEESETQADPNACDPACGESEVCAAGTCVPDEQTPTPDPEPEAEPEAEPDPEPESECGNGECEEGETEVNCPGDCAPNNPAVEICTSTGDLCDEDTEDTDDLACVPFDNKVDERRCRPTCEDNEDCETGSFCGRFGENKYTCIPSNCSDYFSFEDCEGVGDNGANCMDFSNGAKFCTPAGTGEAGDECEDFDSDCGVGLVCFDNVCEAPCPVEGDDTCEGGTSCVNLLTIEEAGMCRVACGGFEDLDGCDEGFGCRPFGEPDAGYCVPAGDIPIGESCEENREGCVVGASCGRATSTDELTCRPYCNRTTDALGDDTCPNEGDICLNSNDVAGRCFPGCTPFSDESGCTEEGRLWCLPIENNTRGVCFPSGEAATGDDCNQIDGSFLGVCDSDSVCYPDDFDDDASPGECRAACDRTSEGFGDATCPGEEDICIGFTTLVGFCDEGCDPFTSVEDNGCDEDGEQFCFPIETHDRGRCRASGEEPIGSECVFPDGSFLGDCDGNGVCLPNNFSDLDEGGVCSTTCPTFSSVNDYDSPCAEDEVCDFFTTLDWGTCSQEVFNPRIPAFEACPESGTYCDEDVYCVRVDQQGNNTCIPFCRLDNGNEDCPTIDGLDLTCTKVFSGDSLGACIPPE
jgi:hypothetical protein